VRGWMLATAVPAILTFALMTITPDILVLCILTYYLYVIFDTQYSDIWRNGILCGLLGGLGYLCKSFVLPFFVIHFFIFSIFHYIGDSSKKNRKTVLKNYMLGMAIFAIICIPWISAISAKYGKIAFGTSGGFVHSLSATKYKEHPLHVRGFIAPTNDTAISAWEDPSNLQMKEWSPLESRESMQLQLQIVTKNLSSKAMVSPDFFPFFLPTILICILFFMPFNRTAFTNTIFCSVTTIAIYCGLYSFVLIIERFLGIVYILVILLGGYMLNRLVKIESLSRHRKTLALALFFALYVSMPLKYLQKHIYYMKWIYDISAELQSTVPSNARLASNREWDKALYIAYHLNGKYYGRAKIDITEDELKSNLQKLGIEYYIEWGQIADFEFLKKYEDVTKGKLPILRVYKIIPDDE